MATIPSRYLIDTNVLLRYANRAQPLHTVVRTSINQLRAQEHHLYMSSQNCIEFWNVVTRPVNRNGFGFLPEDVDATLGWLELAFPLLADTPAIYTEWRQLYFALNENRSFGQGRNSGSHHNRSIVAQYNVSGVQVHDARLVAIMRVNQLSHLLTFNTKDFTRYHSVGFVTVDPLQMSEM